MFAKKLMAGAVAACIASSAIACDCFPPPQNECLVSDSGVGIIVTLSSVTRYSCEGDVDEPFEETDPAAVVNDGINIATVTVQHVYQDNTALGIATGDELTVSTGPNDGLCGYGMEADEQIIMYANADTGSFTADPQTCYEKLPSGDLTTNSCSNNVDSPTEDQKASVTLLCEADVACAPAPTPAPTPDDDAPAPAPDDDAYSVGGPYE